MDLKNVNTEEQSKGAKMANPSPTINFTVNLALTKTEDVGPLTNLNTSGILHPDMHQDDPDQGVTDIAQRQNHRSTWIPTGFSVSNILGSNRELKHGDTFTLYGTQAIYVRDMYGIGYAPADRAVLTVS